MSERAGLERVYWIGGPPDGGKTTVARLLGERFGLEVYHFDRHEREHIGRADPDRQPAMFGLGRMLRELDETAFVEEVWVRQEPEEMARWVIQSWSERVDLVVEDLLALPGQGPVVAEGPGFFPKRIVPLLAERRRLVCLVPTAGFKRASHARREKSAWRFRTSDPERAYRNHVERDLLMGEHYRGSAAEVGVPVIEIDGTRAVQEIADEVAERFGLDVARD